LYILLIRGGDMSGWIENTTFKVPVPEGIMIDVQYRDGIRKLNIPAGVELEADRSAAQLFWMLQNEDNDIVAWRLHKEEVVNIDNDGWMANLGYCPVDDEVLVDVIIDNSMEIAASACTWRWNVYDDCSDITHWRLHKEEKQADKFLEEAYDEDQESPSMPAHLFAHDVLGNKVEYPQTSYKAPENVSNKRSIPARVAQSFSALNEKELTESDVEVIIGLLKLLEEMGK
jgi:hypothetical protein